MGLGPEDEERDNAAKLPLAPPLAAAAADDELPSREGEKGEKARADEEEAVEPCLEGAAE